MTNKPTFSIVTCTWNSAATLADTLASVQRQTCQDVEHIFVDGGSTDGTLEMIAAYPGRKRVLRDVGGGISRAMNQGIEAATGEYVAHLHSDDYYATDDVLATVAERFARERVDWVYGTVQVLKDGALIPPYPMPPFSYRSFAAGHASVHRPVAAPGPRGPPGRRRPAADGIPRPRRQRVFGQQDQGAPGGVRGAQALHEGGAAGLRGVLLALREADAFLAGRGDALICLQRKFDHQKTVDRSVMFGISIRQFQKYLFS
jgi:hypothetical protein